VMQAEDRSGDERARAPELHPLPERLRCGHSSSSSTGFSLCGFDLREVQRKAHRLKPVLLKDW
jgi:hypothetical protein